MKWAWGANFRSLVQGEQRTEEHNICLENAQITAKSPRLGGYVIQASRLSGKQKTISYEIWYARGPSCEGRTQIMVLDVADVFLENDVAQSYIPGHEKLRSFSLEVSYGDNRRVSIYIAEDTVYFPRDNKHRSGVAFNYR